MGLTAAFPILAIPHKSTTEDVYNGYRIPKGSIIYPNVAAPDVALNTAPRRRFMLNDPSVWPEPRSFKPERFLDRRAPDQFNPKEVVLGFGRRSVLHPVHPTRIKVLNLI
jgi:cytochrome P450